MKKMTNKTKIALFIGLVIIGVIGRIYPHAWNLTPLIATTIFAGVYLGKRYTVSLPIVTMLISDVFIGFYDFKIVTSVYISFILSGLIGYYFAKNKKINNIVLSALASSTIFFLITNGAVWFFGTMYTPGFSGLIQSYIAGLPFYRNMMIGDVIYTLSLFGIYEFSVSMIKKYKNVSPQIKKDSIVL